MVEGAFAFYDDLLKHYVRTKGWLPNAKRRLKAINRAEPRALRYFTFCAVTAIDVLMLELARVIKREPGGRFSNVVFFDMTREMVLATQKQIPGAIGFPGKFESIVLAEDVDEEMLVEGFDPLESLPNSPGDNTTINRQMQQSQTADFIKCFPFDVLNLDLQTFLMKPNDKFPGKLINALRKVFRWQKRPLDKKTNIHIDGFSLMFTTQIGPPGLSGIYSQMLLKNLQTNLDRDDSLMPLLQDRTGTNDLKFLQEQHFDLLFKLSVPKLLAKLLMDEDWQVVPETGIIMFEYERPSQDGPYKILHLVMDVTRQVPPIEERDPGDDISAEAQNAYGTLVKQIFSQPEQVVTEDIIDKAALQNDIDRIKHHGASILNHE